MQDTLSRNLWKKGVTSPLHFSCVNLTYAFNSNFMVSVYFHITPYKIAKQWHSVTQGAMFALLTCFHHHSVLWVFTVVSVGPLDEWGLSVSASGGGSTREPIPSLGSSQKWYNLIVVPCWVSLVLCPTRAPPEIVSGASRSWGKALKYKAILQRRLSSPEFTAQPCHFICAFFSQMNLLKPRNDCDWCPFTQQMSARNSEVPSASLPTAVLLSPLKHCLLCLKVTTRIISFNFGDFEYPYLLEIAFWWHYSLSINFQLILFLTNI